MAARSSRPGRQGISTKSAAAAAALAAARDLWRGIKNHDLDAGLLGRLPSGRVGHSGALAPRREAAPRGRATKP